MSTVKISELTEKTTMAGTEEVLINDSGVSKKFSSQRFIDQKDYAEEWATKAEDSLISTSAGGNGSSDYSALHHAAKASASAVAAAASAAAAASTYDNFDDRYLGTKTSDPTVDNDGDALVEGALYFNSTDDVMKVYDGSTWILTSSATLATLDVYKFTATASQTVFTGTDDDGNTLAVKPTAEIVFLNGVALEPTTDYTVTTTTLTLTSGAAVNDEVNVYAFGNFELADHYNKTISDGRYLLDSEVTNLAQVKAFDSSDYATAAQGTTADSALQNVVEDTTPQLGGNLDLNSSNITGTGNIDTTGTLSLTNTSTGDSLTITTTEDTSTAAPVICLKRNSSTPADGDYLGQLKFQGENDADQQVVYAKITAKTSDVTDTTEDGLIEFAVRKAGSNSINARLTHDALKLINGTGLEVAGNITATGALDTGSSNITTTGTINATTVDLGNWTVTESAGVLYFATGGTNKMKLDASGNLTCTGDVTAFGTV